MKYIVYSTICIVNNKIYIGVHKTDDPDIFDGYLGCGVYIDSPSSYKKSKTPFQYAVNKYGVKQFKRTILRVFDNEDEAYKLEAELVNEEFIKRTDNYNYKLGGHGGCPPNKRSKIYMYDLDGNFVKEFDSAFECCKYLNPTTKNGSAVLKAIKLGHILHNHQFSKEKVPCMKKWTPRFGSNQYKRKIGMYDLNGKLIKRFDSLNECRKAGYQNASHAVRDGRLCKGYRFKYLDNINN